MEFSVNSNALTGLSDLMDRRWEDLESGRTYLKSNTQFSALNAGVLNDIWGRHQQVVDEIDSFLSAAAQGFAGRCATAVTDANLTYQHSDLSAAVRADAALPMVGRDPQEFMRPPAAPTAFADQSADRAVFADLRCPAAWLQPPPDHHAEYPLEATFFDPLSPSQWLRQEVWRITTIAAQLGLMPRPVDIFMEIVQPLSGDWARYVGCADVYDNLARLLEDAALCVDDGRTTLGRVWTGNAAAACAEAVSSFAVSLRAAVDPLHQTASAYRSVAEVTRAEAKLLAALFATLLDLIVENALEAPSAGLELPMEITTQLGNLYKVVHLLSELVSTVAKIRAEATVHMASAGQPLAGLASDLILTGTVWGDSPVRAMAASPPNLPRPGSTGFQ